MDELDGTDPWGVTTLQLFELLGDTIESEAPRAVATVVDVDGSAYRRPGAKMVLGNDGSTYGGITAGCLEGPLQEIARDVIADGVPDVITFDLTSDDGEWGLGLGCEGIVDVLVEPADGAWRGPVEAYTEGEPVALVTVVEGTDSVPVGAREVYTRDDSVPSGDRAAVPTCVLESLSDDVESRLVDGRWCRRSVSTADGELTVFIDGIEPADRLLLFGGQPDVRPVSRLARDVGFEVVVATARGGQANNASFPRADRVVSTRPTDLGDLVDERTHAVVMSHNYLDDKLALEALLETDAPYVGVMGPRERFERLHDDLEADGVTFSAADRNRIAAPVGLDLGGGEPIEIALSIVSEVLAVSNDRMGERLCERAAPIHAR
jgi:xanthine dehydrogenase accessory factor